MLALDLVVGPWRLSLSLGPAVDEPAEGDEHLDLTTDHEHAAPWPVGFTGAPAYDDEEDRACRP